MEQCKKNEMENQAGYLSKKVEDVLMAIQLKFDCLPGKIAREFAWYAPEAPEERFGNAPLTHEWRLILFFYNAFIDGRAHFELSSPGWKSLLPLTYKDGVLNALSREVCWQELATEIEVAMRKLTEYFESKLRNTLNSMPGDTVALYYRLVGMRGELEELTQRYAHESDERLGLERIIKQNIPQLQKASQDLHNTRSFLGQSKTIKGIREDIEKVVADLWRVAYPDEPPPAPAELHPKNLVPGVPDDGVALN